MLLRSLHPPIGGALLQEMRRHLADVTECFDQLNTDSTRLVAAHYERIRCEDHASQKCSLCLRSGAESAMLRANAAKAAQPMLRAALAAQLLDFLHAVDPSMTVDEWMAEVGEVWTSMGETRHEAGE